MRRALAVVVSLLLAACSGGSDSPSGSGGAGSGAAGQGGGAGGGGGSDDPADYLDRPLREQVDALERGKITSAGLTQAYLDRIAARDGGPAGVHAVLALDPDALDRAAALDDARGHGALLQGAPILVKDNLDTEGLATTAGSLALADNVPAADAHAVARLRAANGLVLGKTNLSEWANFRGNGASSGWSSLGGQTNNGADTAYNPCGSSSGSAAAVAAGMASAAIGTETDGSIICPSSVNGVVGFKPTVGLISRAGIIPISDSQDTAGPITRTVGDAARMLTALAGRDPADPATQAIPAGLDLDFEAPLAKATLAGKRLGAVQFGTLPLVDPIFVAERARIEAAGAVIVDVQLDHASFGGDEYTVLLYEFKVGIEAYLGAHPFAGGPATLQDLIDFNDAHAAEVMPFFGQEVFLAAEATTGLGAPAYLMAKQRAQAATRAQGIDAALAADQLDALVTISTGLAWVTDHQNGDAPTVVATGPAAVAGYPHLTVPMGKVGTLPVGISFFASAWHDADVLALGHAYESLPR